MNEATDNKAITKQVIIDTKYSSRLLPITADEKVIDIIQSALTELEELKQEVIDRQETEDSLTKWVNELVDEIDELKRYPTQEEVCKALSEYYGLMVRYDDRNDVFQKYVGDGDWIVINIAGLRTEAPHLITLIGRFYQSLEEELK